jgi:hypothetical protein
LSFHRHDRALPLLSPSDHTPFHCPIDTHCGFIRELLFLVVRNLSIPQMIPRHAGDRNDPHFRETSEHE